MAVWYLAHEDELLIDLDEYMRPTKSKGVWGEEFFRKRLRDSIADNKLSVQDVFLVHSHSKDHYQAIIRLKTLMPLIERLVWQLHLGSDLYRGRCDLMRAARGVQAPSLLIRAERIHGFYRKPDRVCLCTEKHKTEEPPDCPIWRELRGMSPWELFGKPDKSPQHGVKLPVGRVPLARIMKRNMVIDYDTKRT